MILAPDRLSGRADLHTPFSTKAVPARVTASALSCGNRGAGGSDPIDEVSARTAIGAMAWGRR